MSSQGINPRDEDREILFGDDAVADYLERLRAGRLTEAEQQVGEVRRGTIESQDRGLDKDECPDENYPND